MIFENSPPTKTLPTGFDLVNKFEFNYNLYVDALSSYRYWSRTVLYPVEYKDTPFIYSTELIRYRL